MQDSQNDIKAQAAHEANRVDEINRQRREARSHASEKWLKEEIAPGFYEEVKELSAVINLQYERGLREGFERSIASLSLSLSVGLEHLEDCLGKPVSGEITAQEISQLSNDAVLEKRAQTDVFRLEMTLTFSKQAEQI
jgi:hypothetical protein